MDGPSRTPPDGDTLRLIERWIRFGLIFLALAVFVYLFLTLQRILVPFVISIILAYVLNPLVRVIEARAIRRSVAVTLLTGATTLVFAGAVYFGVPALAGEIEHIQSRLPEIAKDLKILALTIESELEEKYPMIGAQKVIGPAFEALEARSSELAAEIPKWLMAHADHIILLILVPFNVFFFLRDGDSWMRKLYNLLPNRYVETVLSVVEEINSSLGGYIRGLLIDGAIVGSLIAIGLYVFDVDYWLIIGLVTGIGNLVPYLGPILGFSTACMVALLGAGGTAVILKIIILFSIVKFLDDFFFQVLIVGASAHVHPVLVILSVFLGGYVLGIIGMVIAVPITVSIQVMIRILIERSRFPAMVAARERTLGEHWVC
ncbi:MAG: AI-2E family transporter [Deltaproteobacteria bacterium]|nr:AI-2E family transporter [Deltaproteobacteria bacterium]